MDEAEGAGPLAGGEMDDAGSSNASETAAVASSLMGQEAKLVR